MPPFFDCPRLNATIPLNATTVVSYLVKKHLKDPQKPPSIWGQAKTKTKKWTALGIFFLVIGVLLAIGFACWIIIPTCANIEWHNPRRRRDYIPPPAPLTWMPPPQPKPKKQPKKQPKKPPEAKKKPTAPKIQEIPPFKAPPNYTRTFRAGANPPKSDP
ncbi:hypothetical protein FVEN_g845 [Fusarium venenatum]|nr:hypothetical protein FVEN_g845 [Fusarium venenatum]KAH6967324.1 hypothetical protein EDB82DRAFT_542313 [Fusarium venenatum]